MLEHMRQASAIGSVNTVRERLAAFLARTGADELIFAGSSFDPAVRRRGLNLAMEAVEALRVPA